MADQTDSTEPDGTGNEKNTETQSNVLLDKTTETFQWWNRLSTINAEDPIWLSFLKIGFRIIGILFLIAISPLVLLGILFAFIAAG